MKKVEKERKEKKGKFYNIKKNYFSLQVVVQSKCEVHEIQLK